MIPIANNELELYDILIDDFEDEGGYQERKVGNETLKYISGEQCITRLNKAFGPLGWQFEIKERWYDQEADECVVLGRLTVWRKITLMDGVGYKEVLQPIHHEQTGSQKHNRRKTSILTQEAYDRLNLPDWSPPRHYLYTQLPDGNWRKNDSNEILDTGFDWKGAATDSLKKCASMFGIALILSKRGNKQARNAPQRPQNRPQQPARPQGQGTQNGARPGPQRAAPTGPSFTPPFKSQKVDDALGCRAEGCDVVMQPATTYEIDINGKPERQTTEYITKRSKEEANGAVLCLKHTFEWIMAKRAQGIPLASDPTKAAVA